MRNYAGSALMLIVTMAAAIGSYTVNLRVSAERTAVDKLRNRLVADAREIRTLQAELRTRARFPEMQRWNDGVFQMSAPAAGQFLRSPLQLASYGAAPATPANASRPDVQYAVTAPVALPAPAPTLTVAYAPPAADAARLIRAGYTAAKSPKPVVIDLNDAAAIEAPMERPAPPAAASDAKRPAATANDALPEGGQ